MATEEWIQESLARLESLEEERKKHEDALETASDPATLRMHTQAVERLEVKIRALYAELEAVAAQDGGDDAEEADAGDDLDDAAPEPEPVRAAPARPATPAAAPFSSPPAAAPFSAAPVSPFGEVPPAAPFSSPPADAPAFASTPSFASTPAASFDSGDDIESSGSGSKIGIIIGLVLVLGGAGAYFALGRKPAEEAPPPAAPTEVKVIKSGEVPPDTQGPRTAKGGEIDATHGAHIKETDRRTGGGGGGSSSAPPSSTEPKKKKDDKATKIESTDDPLAGIR
ncbi:hypothetical protein [Nannocystis pusilla]|uniref:hypothetical protein n=1 Tax=Nannocystis pusilla TaxID=889268 RepID=UPI003DA4BACF